MTTNGLEEVVKIEQMLNERENALFARVDTFYQRPDFKEVTEGNPLEAMFDMTIITMVLALVAAITEGNEADRLECIATFEEAMAEIETSSEETEEGEDDL